MNEKIGSFRVWITLRVNVSRFLRIEGVAENLEMEEKKEFTEGQRCRIRIEEKKMYDTGIIAIQEEKGYTVILECDGREVSHVTEGEDDIEPYH